MMLSLVTQIIEEQFPEYAHLPIRPVVQSGHDNHTFHLGDELSIRMPSGEAYASQIEKEALWLPYLQPFLSLPISSFIALGKPSSLFPYPFSIHHWIVGETLTKDNVDQKSFAQELAHFLMELQAIDASAGPKAGAHNFYRGGDLHSYHEEVMGALTRVVKENDRACFLALWKLALASSWKKRSVWVHGDVAPNNLLVSNQRLHAVIDFGILGTGDPACDYAMAWSYFDELNRSIFLDGLDRFLIHRARGWALWKALISVDEQGNLLPSSQVTLHEMIVEHRNQDTNLQK